MLPLLTLRLAARRVPTAFGLARTTGLSSKWVPNTLTRSFMATVLRAEPAKTISKTPAAKKKAAAKKPVKANAKPKVAKKKPAKKVATPKKPKIVRIPKGTKIPKLGPSAYLLFSSKVFKSDVKVSKENIGEVSKACSAAWKALSDVEKQKITEQAAALRAKAREERQAYINSLDLSVLKEINRRRVKAGKGKIHRKREAAHTLPVNGFVRYVRDHPPIPGVTGPAFLKACGEHWKALAPAQRQVYNDAYQAEREKLAA
ncbi:hypothetical protein H0H92_006726 [Tricholoma furcatifolium]|nr:hypothetical protein H0H92_006726 [Tricholoma furcatifolium]